MSNCVRPGCRYVSFYHISPQNPSNISYTTYCHSLQARNNSLHPVKSLPMPGTAQESPLLSCSLLTAPVVRAYTIIRTLWDYYAQPAWLLLYYPLLYLAKVAKRLSVLNSGREIDSRFDVKLTPIKGKGLSWILTHIALRTRFQTDCSTQVLRLVWINTKLSRGERPMVRMSYGLRGAGFLW